MHYESAFSTIDQDSLIQHASREREVQSFIAGASHAWSDELEAQCDAERCGVHSQAMDRAYAH